MARALRNNSSAVLEYVRFGITGVLNTLTDFIVLNGLLSLAPVDRTESVYVACKAASFTVAVVQSFFLNKYWVFKGDTGKTASRLKEGGRFFAVSVAGFVLNVATSSLVFALLGALDLFDPRLRANVGAMAGTLLVLAWNYAGYKLFVFGTVEPK